MKKQLSFYMLFGFILFTASGCLKDTGFDEQKYGIAEVEVKGVAFPQADPPLKGAVTTGITSSTAPVTINGPIITLEQDGYPTSTVNVGVQTNNNLVTAAGYTVFPATAYSLNFTTVPIPAGKKVTDTLKITFPNSSTLDPSKTYAIGFTIISVDQGYKIASNKKEVLFIFSVKNQYDGVYSVVSGFVQRYTSPGVPTVGDALNGSLVGNPDINLITAGPNSVSIPAPANPNPGTLYWAFGNNSQVAGIDNVQVAVNPVTNLVSTSSVLNTTLANWETKENKYDPATKTFTLNFRWNPTSNRREYSVVLKYKGPR